MRNGHLNKPEMARIVRAYRDLDAMQAEIPADTKDRSKDEEAALDILLDARNRLAELIRWQDFPAWQQIERNRNTNPPTS